MLALQGLSLLCWLLLVPTLQAYPGAAFLCPRFLLSWFWPVAWLQMLSVKPVPHGFIALAQTSPRNSRLISSFLLGDPS